MIEVRVSLTITAANDSEADEILQGLVGQSQSWPALPILDVHETSREFIDQRP